MMRKKLSLLSFIFVLSFSLFAGPPLSGTLTVGPGKTFETISEAIDSMKAVGIDDKVIVSIDPKTYVEQIVLDGGITNPGNDTIFFEGNGALHTSIISFTSSSIDNYVVKLSGQGNIVFKNLKFDAADQSYGRVFYIEQAVSNLRLEKCKLTSPITNYNFGGGQQSLFYGANLSSLSSYFEIEACEFHGGDRGVHIQGSDFGTNSFRDLTIKGNNFLSQYDGAVHLDKIQVLSLDKNVMFSDNATSTQTCAYVQAKGNVHINNNHVDWNGGLGFLVENHTKVSPFDKLHVSNNKISCVRKAALFNAANNSEIYNNTFYSNDSGEKTVEFMGEDTMSVKNNIFYNAKGGGALATEQFDVQKSTSDYNNFYCLASLYLIQFNGVWRTALNINVLGVEQNSKFDRINFRDSVSLELKCNNINDFAVPQLPFIDEDFDGEVRESLTWVGADKQHIDPVKDLVTIDGWLTDGSSDTLKNATLKIFADVSGKQQYDMLHSVVLSDTGYFKFENIEGYSPIHILLESSVAGYVNAYHEGKTTWENNAGLIVNTCASNFYNVKPRKLVNLPTGTNTITGTIYLETTGKTTNPIPGLDVVLDKIPPANGQTVAVTQTNAGGVYTFNNLPDSTYKIYVDYTGVGLTEVHEVDLTNAGGTTAANLDYCVDTADVVDACGDITYIKNVNDFEFDLFPNPADNIIAVNVNENGVLNIFNNIGELVKSFTISNGNNTVNVNDLKKGIYFVKVSSVTGKVSSRSLILK